MKKLLFVIAIYFNVPSMVSGLTTDLELTFFVEGFSKNHFGVITGLMTPVLSDLSFVCGPAGPNDVDLVTVELHSSGTPYAIVPNGTASGILQTNGLLQCTFTNLAAGNYYIAIAHSHALETWSVNPVPFPASGLVTYDFLTPGMVYGNNLKNIRTSASPFWTVFSGDVNQNGAPDLPDWILLMIDAANFSFGCIPTDFDGDGAADIVDATILENNMKIGVGKKRPY